MKLLYGKEVADNVYSNLEVRINNLIKRNIIPHLSVIIVGKNKDSLTYVKMKERMCKKLGIKSTIIYLPYNVQNNELLSHINKINNDPYIHGLLVQLPLPVHLDTELILQNIKIDKDVDGFTNINTSKLIHNSNPLFKPCTPEGCIELLKYYNIETEGKHAVIIGRSQIVGKPLAHMLLNANSTVTICHSKTKNIEKICKMADLLFVACGKPNFIKGNMIKEGVIIIDIGINAISDIKKKKGYSLVGDVDIESVQEKCNSITPVPKGIGPLTICMLMKHTVESAERSFK